MNMREGYVTNPAAPLNTVIQMLDKISSELREHLWGTKTLNGNQLNERYLHHLLTHRLQQEGCSILPGDGKSRLFPEWPSWKKGVLDYRKYKKFKVKDPVDGKERDVFNPIPTAEMNKHPKLGSAGYFDFCIGTSYDKPSIGIELLLKHGWAREEFTFDFMKILDRALPFQLGLAYGIILRPNGLPEKKSKDEVAKAMNDALELARTRLGSDVTGSRTYQLVVLEIAPEAIRRWACTSSDGVFQETPLPTLAL